MTFSDNKVERVAFGLILCTALLMFFQPLVRLHGPNGSQLSNAFGVGFDLSRLQSNLGMMATTKAFPGGASPVSTAGAPVAARPLAMPFSLRMASLVPWFVFAALGFCLLALLDLLLFRKAVSILSFLGACLGGIALLHVMLMGSDLQSWTDVLTNTALVSSADGPGSGGLVMMANSFLVSPAFGLYMLTACLFSVPALSSTRAVPRVRSVMRQEQRVSLEQPVCVRPVNSRYAEENCTTIDVSKGGLLLESALGHYYVGMEVYLARSAAAGSPANAEEHGSVVRVDKLQSGKCRLGIRLISQG